MLLLQKEIIIKGARHNNLKNIDLVIPRNKLVVFTGVSGSGKSYRALEVAAEKGLKYVIDDGLLISERRVIAGRSAKKEKTRLASVRCALFFNEEHAEDVKKAKQQLV